MRKALAAAVAVAVAGLVGLAAPANATTPGPAPGALSHARTVTTFDPGGGWRLRREHGAGRPREPRRQRHRVGQDDNTGQLWLVRRDGSKSPFGPAIPLGGCAMLLGVAVDHGRVFVGSATTTPGTGGLLPDAGPRRPGCCG